MRDSLELSLEIGEFYRETEQILKALEWGDSITNKYPREAAGYVYLMGLYDQRQDYGGQRGRGGLLRHLNLWGWQTGWNISLRRCREDKDRGWP